VLPVERLKTLDAAASRHFATVASSELRHSHLWELR
jgi:hypothetical protein